MANSITIKLAGVMIAIYEENPLYFKEIIVSGSVHRSIMVNIYELLIKDNSLTRIEDLEIEYKNKIWERCKPMINGRLPKEQCIDVVRAMHTLDLLLKQ